MAAIIMEIKFVFHFGIGRIRSLAKWSVHSLWLLFSFQFWSKGPWKCICSIITSDKKGGGEGGTERRCSLLSLHTFQISSSHLLQQTVRSGAQVPQGSAFPLWYLPLVLSSAELGSQEPQPSYGGDICPLLNLCTWASLLALLSLISTCFVGKPSISLQPRQTNV